MTAPIQQVTHAPNFTRLYAVIDEEFKSALVDIGFYQIRDTAQRIGSRVDLHGLPQKENSPGYAKWKKRHRGHDVPLRRGDSRAGVGPGGEQFGDPFRNYRINNVPIQAVTASRVPFPPGPLRVRLTLPPQREVIASQLTKMGYRIPWGVSDPTKRWARQRLVAAIQIAKKRFQSGGDILQTLRGGGPITGGRIVP